MKRTAKQKAVFEATFPIVEASRLSLRDKFLTHEPETISQKKFKEEIMYEIEVGLKDFRHPIVDPSEDGKGNIIFIRRNKPAVGHSANWCDLEAQMFMPSKNSRLGNEKHYNAFLAIIIKYLIEEEGYLVSNAWQKVCDRSKNLGRFRNYRTRLDTEELTGDGRVGRWCDLTNTCKIIRNSKNNGFLIKGRCFEFESNYSLTTEFNIESTDYEFSHCVPWIILDV